MRVFHPFTFPKHVVLGTKTVVLVLDKSYLSFAKALLIKCNFMQYPMQTDTKKF